MVYEVLAKLIYFLVNYIKKAILISDATIIKLAIKCILIVSET